MSEEISEFEKKVLSVALRWGWKGVSREDYFLEIRGIGYQELERALRNLEKQGYLIIEWTGPSNFVVTATPEGIEYKSRSEQQAQIIHERPQEARVEYPLKKEDKTPEAQEAEPIWEDSASIREAEILPEVEGRELGLKETMEQIGEGGIAEEPLEKRAINGGTVVPPEPKEILIEEDAEEAVTAEADSSVESPLERPREHEREQKIEYERESEGAESISGSPNAPELVRKLDALEKQIESLRQLIIVKTSPKGGLASKEDIKRLEEMVKELEKKLGF